MDLKQELKERFNALYPGCKLFEIFLSHTTFQVFYKEDSGLRHIDRIDVGVFQWGVVENYKDEGGNIESDNLPKTRSLFEGINPKCFMEQHEKISYKDMYYWTAPF